MAVQINAQELTLIARLVREVTGIVLDERKAYLIESRLGPLLEEFRLTNYNDLYQRARSDTSQRILNKIVDAITTNETFFFRDNSPFDMLRYKLIPDIIDRSDGKNIKVWSAACSTGQEVYSIAMILREILPNTEQWNIRLLGTDISDAAVAQASYGSYNKTEINRGLPPNYRTKYFNEGPNTWRIRDEVRAMTMFRRMNLLEPFSSIGKYDLILCRNVAIYFSPENRKKLFDQIANQLNPSGYLMIGASESLVGISERFERKSYHNSIVYVRTV